MARRVMQSSRRLIYSPSFSRFFSAVQSAVAVTPAPDSKKEKIRHVKKEINLLPPINIFDALPKLKSCLWARFDETIEIAVKTSLDPRKPNQSIKGMASLPHGNGKKVRIAVFATGSEAQSASEAGADIVGSDELIARVVTGDIPFDRVIATPDMMAKLGKIGKILGPRGLMPNPKLGTVTKDVAKAVKAAKAGSVQFRVEKMGIVQAGIGKASFPNEHLLENIRSFMIAVCDCKPEGYKGKYLTSIHLSSTMGPGILLDMASVDPTNAKFMLDPSKFKKN